MSVIKEELLQRNIRELPFGMTLKESLADASIANLAELLQLPIYQWQKRIKGLTYAQLREVIDFVIVQRLDKYLKEE